jgi:hypothetical protein
MGFVCWRPEHENPSFTIPLQAALHLLPEPPKANDPNAPGPFALSDATRTRTILERAGFTAIDIAPRDTDIVFAGRADMEGAVDLALRVGPLSRAAANLSESTVANVRDAVRKAFKPHLGPAGVVLRAATWVVTARASLEG